MQALFQFVADEDGTTAVEYAVILMVILLTIIGAVQFFGGSTRDSFDETSGALSGAFAN